MRNGAQLVLACVLPLLCCACSGAREGALEAAVGARDGAVAARDAAGQKASRGGASPRGGGAASSIDAAIQSPPGTRSAASVRDASSDAAVSDAAKTSSMARPTTDAAQRPTDAALQPTADAAAPSGSVDAGNSGCSSHLCTTPEGAFLHVEGDEPWMVGALDWLATVGTRSLGWSSGATSDNRNLFYALSRRDVAELEAGGKVLVDYGSPGSTSTSPRARVCPFEKMAPAPSCPQTLQPLLHVSMRGCRNPQAVGCAACQETGAASSFRSSDGADWYNVSTSTAPASCRASCPPCASCTDHDAEQARALPERPECELCPDGSVDACFEPKSCDCWCHNRQVLAAACPTLAP